MELGAIGAQQAMFRQNLALSLVKQANEADKAIVGILEQSAENIKGLSRGSNVNISA